MVVSGPATISGGKVTLLGPGTVTIRASQAGNAVYLAAPSVTHSFTVTPSQPPVAQIYVADAGSNSVTDYALAATGNASPTATISGISTGLSFPSGIAVDANNIYVTNDSISSVPVNTVTVYARNATGNAKPIATISGNNTKLNSPCGIAVNASHIFVANSGNNSITVYALTANGNASPVATISGGKTGLIPVDLAVDAGHIYVTNTDSVTIYALTANGNIAPTATISGSNTGLSPGATSEADLNGIAVTATHIFVINSSSNSILVYPLTANGNIAPTATISGNNTGLTGFNPSGIAVNASQIFVTNGFESTNTVTVYPLASTGNASPTATISGSNTGIKGPTGIAVAP
jgi:6-phosphogluconolactonase (cycloisomerase 2 family)